MNLFIFILCVWMVRGCRSKARPGYLKLNRVEPPPLVVLLKPLRTNHDNQAREFVVSFFLLLLLLLQLGLIEKQNKSKGEQIEAVIQRARVYVVHATIWWKARPLACLLTCSGAISQRAARWKHIKWRRRTREQQEACCLKTAFKRQKQKERTKTTHSTRNLKKKKKWKKRHTEEKDIHLMFSDTMLQSALQWSTWLHRTTPLAPAEAVAAAIATAAPQGGERWRMFYLRIGSHCQLALLYC